jgi:hypothetical protein
LIEQRDQHPPAAKGIVETRYDPVWEKVRFRLRTDDQRARRLSAHAAETPSRIIPTSSPHGVSVGAAAAALAHVPTCPGRLQRSNGSVQAVSQQTLSTQFFDAHCPEPVQPAPLGCGVGVSVAVAVSVLVAVCVGVEVDVVVAVMVAVAVTLGVAVGVAEGVGLAQLPLRPPLQEPPGTKRPPANAVHVVWSVSTHVAESAPDVSPARAALPSSQHPVVAQLPPAGEQGAVTETFRLHEVCGVWTTSHAPRQFSGVVSRRQPGQPTLLPTFSQEQQTPSPEYARLTNSARLAIATTVQRAVNRPRVVRMGVRIATIPGEPTSRVPLEPLRPLRRPIGPDIESTPRTVPVSMP